jgi:hypothetical protein
MRALKDYLDERFEPRTAWPPSERKFRERVFVDCQVWGAIDDELIGFVLLIEASGRRNSVKETDGSESEEREPDVLCRVSTVTPIFPTAALHV